MQNCQLCTYIWKNSSFATGLGTPIRRGLSNISLLRWSPSGDYLLAAKLYGQFPFLYLHFYLLIFPKIYIIHYVLAMELFTSGRQTHGLQNLGLHLTAMCLYVTFSVIDTYLFLTFFTLEKKYSLVKE